MEGFGACETTLDGTLTIEVWLFGYLALLTGERRVSLELPADVSAGEVIARLAARYGEEFIKNVLETSGAKLTCCRIFLDGLPVEDIAKPLVSGDAQAAGSAVFEMIMLSAYEGG